MPGSTVQTLGLDELVQIALEQNPGLAQAAYDVDAAEGRAVQAGLYPNPIVHFSGEEIGRGSGVYSVPEISQEIVTAGKLRLNQGVARRQADQAYSALVRQRYLLLASVRQGYFELLGIQQRVEALEELVKVAAKSLGSAEALLRNKLLAELDLLPFRIEVNRLRAEVQGAEREQAAAWRRLAATVGAVQLAPARLRGSVETPTPAYDFHDAQAFVIEFHPEVQAAAIGIQRAELALKREEAQRFPNLTVGAGYQRNVEARQDQAAYQVAFPVPLFNRNQGNIQAAKAELGRAIHEVNRVRNDLSNRLATAFGQYEAARKRADALGLVKKDAEDAYRKSLLGFKGGQFEIFRLLQAQRSAVEANLELIRALTEAWRAAAEISALVLEEDWPRRSRN